MVDLARHHDPAEDGPRGAGEEGRVLIHPKARAFDTAADVYERARPGYPAAALDWILETLELEPGDRVVDVGAGTGKFSRQLVARGLEVTAVEPLAGMRAVLSRELPAVEVVAGTGEAIPLEDGAAAALTVAQAFHWFDPDRAMPEFRRVLRPHGGLALVWNVRDESHPVHSAYAETIRPYRGGDYPEMQQSARFFADSELFTPYEERRFDHAQVLDAEGLVARAESVSFIAALPDDERAQLLERVRELAPPGRFEFPYVTRVFTCRRR